jgi:alpha-beta hydrolase superfamily lysophospholipase
MGRPVPVVGFAAGRAYNRRLDITKTNRHSNTMQVRRASFLPIAVLAWLMALLSACSNMPSASPEPAHFKVGEGAEGRRFRTADDLTLFGQWWQPSGPVKAVVLLVHGTGVHSGFYNTWANELAANGYAVFGIDLRGWGQSQGFGLRGYVNNYDEYVDDAFLAYREIRFRYPNQAVYIEGDSLGADVALLAAITNRIPAAGLILQAPALKPDPGIGWFHVGDFSVATAAVFGHAMPNSPVFPMSVFAKLAFEDPDARQRFLDDPLCVHSALPAAYLIAMEDASDRIIEHFANVKLPVLVLHGGKDNLVPLSSSQLLMKGIASQDKIIRVYDRMSHELMHDSGHDEVWTDILGWLDARVQRAAAAQAQTAAAAPAAVPAPAP